MLCFNKWEEEMGKNPAPGGGGLGKIPWNTKRQQQYYVFLRNERNMVLLKGVSHLPRPKANFLICFSNPSQKY